jgi:hypothetical protein
MLVQAVIGACLEALEDFNIGSLNLAITLWMINGCIVDLDAKILTVSLECAAGELGSVVSDDPVWVPNLQMMDLMNLVVDYLLILTTGVTSGHLVHLSMVTYRYRNSLTALGNRPRMSSPHTANGHEGGIICSVYTGVWIRMMWNWHASHLFTSSMASWRVVGQ